MPSFLTALRLASLLLPASLATSSSLPAAALQAQAQIRPQGLITQFGEGERRIRRPREGGSPGLTSPFTLLVDRRNGGSPDLVMGYEEVAPGDAIRAHHHLLADEIIIVRSGSGRVSLGDRVAEIGAGGTVYIPRNTRIAVRNTGSAPLAIYFIFSKPGFEELMRDNSVLEGETATPISAAERARIEARNRWHTIHEE
jgi:mannose-6-phosphate isomerase-like protein (cupin superfamily)